MFYKNRKFEDEGLLDAEPPNGGSSDEDPSDEDLTNKDFTDEDPFDNESLVYEDRGMQAG